MKTSIYKLILLTGIFFSGATILNSCSKADAIDSISLANSPVSAKQTVTNNLFDRDLVVTMAKDDNTDITSNFNGITFHFTSADASGGRASAWNDILTVNGAWSMDENIIGFSYPTDILTQLAFFNKQWSIPTTVSTSGTIVLTAANGENDVVYFSGK